MYNDYSLLNQSTNLGYKSTLHMQSYVISTLHLITRTFTMEPELYQILITHLDRFLYVTILAYSVWMGQSVKRYFSGEICEFLFLIFSEMFR